MTDITIAEPDSTFIWGAANIGRTIGRNQRQTLHLLVSGKIKSARKVGAHWVANRLALPMVTNHVARFHATYARHTQGYVPKIMRVR